jgi:hypothetical protein
MTVESVLGLVFACSICLRKVRSREKVLTVEVAGSSVVICAAFVIGAIAIVAEKYVRMS